MTLDHLDADYLQQIELRKIASLALRALDQGNTEGARAHLLRIVPTQAEPLAWRKDALTALLAIGGGALALTVALWLGGAVWNSLASQAERGISFLACPLHCR